MTNNTDTAAANPMERRLPCVAKPTFDAIQDLKRASEKKGAFGIIKPAGVSGILMYIEQLEAYAAMQPAVPAPSASDEAVAREIWDLLGQEYQEIHESDNRELTCEFIAAILARHRAAVPVDAEALREALERSYRHLTHPANGADIGDFIPKQVAQFEEDLTFVKAALATPPAALDTTALLRKGAELALAAGIKWFENNDCHRVAMKLRGLDIDTIIQGKGA